MTFDLMQWADEETGEGGGGGLNLICQFSLSGGYLVYAKGPREDRYFPAGPGIDAGESKYKAKDLAKKLTETTGKEVRYQPVVSLYLYKDSVLNREVKWQGEYWAHDIVNWSDAFTKVLQPSIQATLGDKLVSGQKYWGHIAGKPDPYQGKSEKRQVPYIVQVFESKEEALEAIGSEGGAQIPAQPEKWSEDALGQWNIFAEDAINHFKENPDSDGSAVRVDIFGVDEAMLNKFRAIAEEETIPF